MDTIEIVSYTIIALVFVAVFIWWVIIQLQFKHKVICIDAGSNDLVQTYKAKDKVVDGVRFWRLAGEKDKELRDIAVPQQKALKLTKKGKKVLFTIRTPEGTYENLNIDSDEVEAVQPLSSKQRMIQVHNIRKAEERRGIKWQEHIPVIVSIGALVLIVLGLMIFWGDIAKPALDAREIGLQEQKARIEYANILRDIQQNQQYIKDKVNGNDGPPD